jgi:hypothetical protein
MQVLLLVDATSYAARAGCTTLLAVSDASRVAC